MAALAEVLWCSKGEKEYGDFVKRLVRHFDLLDMLQVNYAKSIYELKTSVSPAENNEGIVYEITTPFDVTGIRYTTDGTDPGIYSEKYVKPILIRNSCTIRSAYFEHDRMKGKAIEQRMQFTLSTGKKIVLRNEPAENYREEGAFTLVDGITGDPLRQGSCWLGWSGKDMDATIDLGKMETIHELRINSVDKIESWIYLPKKVSIYGSADGVNFTFLAAVNKEEINHMHGKVKVGINGQQARYIRVVAECAGKIPEGAPGAGEYAWLFIDEIMIN
jgi:hexosaminidase